MASYIEIFWFNICPQTIHEFFDWNTILNELLDGLYGNGTFLSFLTLELGTTWTRDFV